MSRSGRPTDDKPDFLSTRLATLWELRNQATLDFCAAAALYSEAIEHREGLDGGFRFLVNRCDLSDEEARDVLVIGRGIVGHLTVPRADWDEARAAVAMPLIERAKAALDAAGPLARDRARNKKPSSTRGTGDPT